jgi:hypothetical protein
MEWQPIETAPRDTPILIRSKAGYIATAERRLHGWALVDSFIADEGYGGPFYLADAWEPVEWRKV